MPTPKTTAAPQTHPGQRSTTPAEPPNPGLPIRANLRSSAVKGFDFPAPKATAASQSAFIRLLSSTVVVPSRKLSTTPTAPPNPGLPIRANLRSSAVKGFDFPARRHTIPPGPTKQSTSKIRRSHQDPRRPHYFVHRPHFSDHRSHSATPPLLHTHHNILWRSCRKPCILYPCYFTFVSNAVSMVTLPRALKMRRGVTC